MDEELDQTQTQDTLGEVAEGAKKVAGKAKQTADKAKQKLAKKATKKVASGATKVMANPLFWKIAIIVAIVLLAIILLVAIIAIIAYALTASDYDPATGRLSSMYGISGDKFYGARFIYQDNDSANLEIEDDYLKFTYQILQDTSSSTGLSITLSADYKTDSIVNQIATDFANDLVQNTNAQMTLAQCIVSIDHFGFTADESQIALNSIASSLAENAWASKSQAEIKSALDGQYQSTAYASYANVCPKLYVWDYILDGEDDTLKQLPKKDYYGIIYMPKEQVTFSSLSFMFVVDGGYGVDVTLMQKSSGQDATALCETANANAGWYYDNHMQEFYECETTVPLQQFTAIDTNNVGALSTQTSVYSLLADGNFLTYFNSTDDYSGASLMQNVADANYLYLALDNKDENRAPFNVAEHIVEYA